MNNDKIKINLYRLNNDSFIENTFKNRIKELEALLNQKCYNNIELRSIPKSEFDFALFYCNKDYTVFWKEFLKPIIENADSYFFKHSSIIESFVLLIRQKKLDSIYAVTGGQGFNAIWDYVEDDFGLEILLRLVERNEKVIKRLAEKNLMGGIFGATKNFRRDHNLDEDEVFGKIYSELKAHIDFRKLSQYCKLPEKDFRKGLSITGKSSLKIEKMLTWDQLLNLVKGCERIYNECVPIQINSVTRIYKRKNESLIDELNEGLIKQLWDRYSHNNEDIDFDICHQEFEQYLTAARYKVIIGSSKNYQYFDELKNIDELFGYLKTMALYNNPKNIDEFKEIIQKVKIISLDENDIELTSGKFYTHIFGDVINNDIRYFLIDNKWFRIKDNFLKELDQGCENFISKNSYSGDLEKWPSGNDEDHYNKLYNGQNNTLVLHRVLNENIEGCDIMKWTNNEIRLFFVKKGFNNSMRDLCAQLLLSAKRITRDINDKKQFLSGIYDSLKSKLNSKDGYLSEIANQTQIYSKDEFLQVFSARKKTIFILAIYDTTQNRSINNMKRYRSNIAKFSLSELFKEMKGIDIELQIVQIK
ncbi:MAG: DUF6119 family protein [Candidatus Zixiibacteriota bacterium]